MSDPIIYNGDQKDALQELLNIAMGQAADSLARALGEYVKITIPNSNIIEAEEFVNSIGHIEEQDKKVTAVRQAFFGDLQGEAIAIYGVEDGHQIADLMGYDELDEVEEHELLLDISNVLVGACMTGFGKQIDANIGYSPPKIMASNIPLRTLLSRQKPAWEHSLVIKLNFGLTERSFMCEMVFFMPESSIEKVRNALELFLESL